MVLGISNCNIQSTMGTALKEKNCNATASNYIAKNRDKLIKYILSRGISYNNAEDLLQDVAARVIFKEGNDEPFIAEYADVHGINPSKNNNNDEITVEQYIYSKIRKYAENDKYKDGITIGAGTKNSMRIELLKRSPEDENDMTDDEVFDIHTLNNDTEFNRRGPVDTISTIEASVDIRRDINYCIDIGNENNIDIVNIFNKIELIASMIGSNNDSIKGAFSELANISSKNARFKEALVSVLTYSQDNNKSFKNILTSLC